MKPGSAAAVPWLLAALVAALAATTSAEASDLAGASVRSTSIAQRRMLVSLQRHLPGGDPKVHRLVTTASVGGEPDTVAGRRRDLLKERMPLAPTPPAQGPSPTHAAAAIQMVAVGAEAEGKGELHPKQAKQAQQAKPASAANAPTGQVALCLVVIIIIGMLVCLHRAGRPP
mmetsp:Transcript_166939/g.535926  ORF Transcript_166939/g.535926 Transcript_166939/m.535926 type:complete len:172 (-) Transcript_166939:63-578(-)